MIVCWPHSTRLLRNDVANASMRLARNAAARFLLTLCMLVALIGPALAGTDDMAPLVIVLSWDGIRHDYPDRAELPALSRMQRDGARALRLIPPWPSNTFPGHVTLATGALANVHGIVDNRFYDRERGYYRYSADADWIEAEPLWIAAERQGVRAATYFWVGSETDWRGHGTSYRRAPFDPVALETDKVDQIIEWIDLPTRERPGLIMSYWRGADRVGHDLGPDHPQIVDELLDQDRELARLQQALDDRGLWPSTTLIVVSDHGMTRISEFFDLAAFLEKRDFHARLSGSATVKHVFLDDPARAAEVVRALDGKARVRAYAAGELPVDITLDHPTRNGDVVVIADAPLILELPLLRVRTYFRLMNLVDGRSPGTHGYDPEHPDMASVLFAMGRGVPAGTRLGRVHMVDVAPTAAHLLGIDPPRDASGRALFEP
jgi:arylsulfatase A-like enzyme